MTAWIKWIWEQIVYKFLKNLPFENGSNVVIKIKYQLIFLAYRLRILTIRTSLGKAK